MWGLFRRWHDLYAHTEHRQQCYAYQINIKCLWIRLQYLRHWLSVCVWWLVLGYSFQFIHRYGLCLIHTLRNRLISMRFGWHQWNTPKRANPRHRRSILSRWSHKWSTVCGRYTLPDQFDFGVSPFDRFFIQTKFIRSQCIPIHLQHSMRSPCRMCHSWCFQCIESTAK